MPDFQELAAEIQGPMGDFQARTGENQGRAGGFQGGGIADKGDTGRGNAGVNPQTTTFEFPPARLYKTSWA